MIVIVKNGVIFDNAPDMSAAEALLIEREGMACHPMVREYNFRFNDGQELFFKTVEGDLFDLFEVSPVMDIFVVHHESGWITRITNSLDWARRKLMNIAITAKHRGWNEQSYIVRHGQRIIEINYAGVTQEMRL